MANAKREIVIVSEIQSVRVSSVPGDELRRLTAPATTSDGRTLPAGTEYRPVSGGADNDTGKNYQRIMVG